MFSMFTIGQVMSSPIHICVYIIYSICIWIRDVFAGIPASGRCFDGLFALFGGASGGEIEGFRPLGGYVERLPHAAGG